MKKIAQKIFFRKKLKVRTIIALVLIAILLPIAVFSLYKPQGTEASWFDDTYQYRQRFTFTHNADISSPRAITFSLDTAELIAAGVMQADCDDTRFTDTNGSLLSFQLTGTCNNAATTYEVVFPTIINGTNLGYVYYGSPSATNASIDVTSVTALTPSGGDPAITTRTSEEKGQAPISYWSFNEGSGQSVNDSLNVNDATLGANSGSSTDDPTWKTEEYCVSGKCLSFDGGDTVNAADSSSLDLVGALTVQAWIKGTSWESVAPNIDGILDKGGQNADQGYFLRIGDTGAAGVPYFGIGAGGSEQKLSAGATLNTNQWYFLVGVYDGTNLKIYIDGKEVATSSIGSLTIGNSTEPLRIGFNWDGRYFNGFIDEPKVYNYARTAAQIKGDFVSKGGSEGASVSLGGSNQKFLSDGLVGYWKMDETSTPSIDYSGRGYNATWNGDAATATGKFAGGIAQADGGSGFLSVADTGDPHDMGTNNFSVSMWFYLDSLSSPDAPELLSKRDGGAFCAGSEGYHFRVAYNNEIEMTVEGLDSCIEVNSASNAISTGQWYHVVGVYDSVNGSRVYVNGTQSGSTTTGNVGNTNNAGQLRMGIGVNGWELDGTYDEYRIYNRALSSDEVAALYNWAPGPLGYWKLDDASGTNGVDSTGNGYHFTLNGNFNFNADSGWNRGKFGRGLQFDGSNDVAQSATSAFGLVGSGNFTLETWVKADTISGSTNHRLITYQQGSGGTDGYHLALVSSGNGTCGSRFLLEVEKSDTKYTSGCSSSNSAAVINTWYHLAGVFEGATNTATLYVNGVKQVAGSAVNLGLGVANTLTLASQSTAGTNLLDGTLDEVQIYNYARTSQQVVEDLNAGHPIGGSPVGSQILYWKFDDMKGTTAQDSGPNNYDGTLLCGGASCTVPTWKTDGKINQALYFSASNGTAGDYVRASPINMGTNSGDTLTFTAWVKPVSTETNNGWIVRNGHSTDENYSVKLTNLSGGKWRVGAEYYSDATFRNIAGTQNVVTDDAWNHIAVVFTNGISMKIYVNGKYIETVAWSGSPSVTATTNFYIGGHAGTTNQFFGGYIDDVKVYSSALTDEQVKIDANAGGGINFGATANTEASLLSDGAGNPPVAYWNMDEKQDNTCSTNDVCDKSGNGNDGANTGSPAWTRGKIGSALQFDGSDDYVDFGDIQNFAAADSFSVFAWIKPTTLNSNNRIIAKGRAGDCFNYLFEVNSAGTLRFGSTPSSSSISSSGAIQSGNWYHVGFTYVNGSVTGYINGKAQLTASHSASESCTYSLKVGSTIGTLPGYFTGSIDEIKIYDYARTASQVAYDYNRGAPIAHWKFDECQGSTVNDASGNGHTGTINVGDTSGDNDSVGNCSGAASTEMWGEGATGKFNSGLGFDGTNDYISVPTGNTISFGGDFTISSWFKTSEGSERPIVSNRTNPGAMYYGIAAGKGFIYQTSATPPNLSTTRTVNDNAWHHFVYVRTGTTTNLYLDGKLDATTTQTGYSTSMQPIRIGHDVANSTEYFSGLIDEVQIYSYALSADQVEKLYNQNASVRFGPSTGTP